MSPPRILYTAADLAGLEVDAKQVLLWPCHMFTVALPTRPTRSLNVFESTVLRLVQAGYGDPQQLARYTCLEPGMVNAILRRLMALRYLDTSQRPLVANAEGAAPNWQTGRVFVDLIGGRLLSRLSFETPEYSECRDERGHSFKAGGGNITARMLRHEEQHIGYVPTPRQVHAIARIQARRDSQRSGAAESAVGGAAQALSVMGVPERVYLATSVALQSGNYGEVIVADPFGAGLSGHLAEVFAQCRAQNQQFRQIADGLLEAASIGGQQRGEMKATVIGGRYPELHGKLRDAAKARDEASAVVRDSEGAARAERATGRSLWALYEAVELALHAVVVERPPEPGLLALLASQSYWQNGELLWRYVQKLGLHGSEQERRLLQLAPGKFRRPEGFAVELWPLLALALAVACCGRDGGHPLRMLAEAQPDLLVFLQGLKGYRDPATHGGAVTLPREELQSCFERVGSVLDLLLPDRNRAVEQTVKPHAGPGWLRNQARLKARIAAGAALAPASLDQLQPLLRNACLDLELLAEEGDANGMAFSLSSMLQLALADARQSAGPGQAGGGELRELALRNAVAAGFDLQGGRLPVPLRTAAVGRVRAAMASHPSTVQAAAMALLICGDRVYLSATAARLPGLLTLAGCLAELRGHGHGNLPPLAQLTTLRTQVYQSIPYLTEI